MNLDRGRVAVSKAGRDKGLFLAVLAYEDGRVWLADGGERPLEHPKQKNVKHIALTHTVLPEKELTTNRALRKALAQMQENV